MILLIVLSLFNISFTFPINLVQKVAENDFEKFDNYLPKNEEYNKFHYSTYGENKRNEIDLLNTIDSKNDDKENPRSLSEVVNFVKEGAAAGMELLTDLKSMIIPTSKSENETQNLEATTTEIVETTTDIEMTTLSLVENPQINPVLEENDNSTTNRTVRQEEETKNDNTDTEQRDKESQEEEEEEPPNMITGLISALLGGLSRPDGSIDVEAITGLLGSLSSQREDGSYDFNGLTELLMSFFGGGGEEGGGSDFGAFLGGLAGAFIQGVANPPGAKGAGTFVGNLLGGILPGLSAPAPAEEGEEEKPQPSLDSGGFLNGLLSSIFGNLGTLSTGSSGGGNNNNAGGGGNKFSLFKALFSMITSIFSSSSAGAPK